MTRPIFLILLLILSLCSLYSGCGEDASYNIPNPTVNPTATGTTGTTGATGFTGALTVTVTAGGSPVNDAVLSLTRTIAGSGIDGLTCSQAANVYTFTELTTGSYRLTIEATGYNKYINDIVISAGENNINALLSLPWASQNTGLSSGQLDGVYFVNSNTGWAVGGTSDVNGSGMIVHTTDGGFTWTLQNSGITHGSLHGVYFADTLTGWAVGMEDVVYGVNVPVILRTKDGGTTWTRQTITGVTEGELRGVDFVSSTEGWATGNSLVLHTTDEGATWTPQTSGISDGFSVDFVSSAMGWAVGSNIVHTENGGSSWTPQTSGISNISLRGVRFVNSTTGWAVGYAGSYPWTPVILHTTDGGTTWSSQNAGMAEGQLMGLHFIDSSTGWAVGYNNSTNNMAVIHTTDGGSTWVRQNTLVIGDLNYLNAIHFSDGTNGWAVGNDFNIIPVVFHTADGGTTWAKTTEDYYKICCNNVCSQLAMRYYYMVNKLM